MRSFSGRSETAPLQTYKASRAPVVFGYSIPLSVSNLQRNRQCTLASVKFLLPRSNYREFTERMAHSRRTSYVLCPARDRLSILNSCSGNPSQKRSRRLRVCCREAVFPMSFQMIPCFPVASPKLANASFWAVFLAVLLSLNVAALASERAAENSPPSRRALSVLPSNPYFFQDTSGRPVTLVGDYTWGAFSDLNYDYVRFFDSLHARGLNVARVWLWWGCEEIASDPIPARHIEPYLRPGPGMANDDRPKYDLTRFNPAFFARLDAFCRAAKRSATSTGRGSTTRTGAGASPPPTPRPPATPP